MSFLFLEKKSIWYKLCTVLAIVILFQIRFSLKCITYVFTHDYNLLVTNISVTSKFGKFFSTLSVNNVLNEKYHNYAVASSSTLGAYNAYPEPSRVIIFSLGTNF